MTSAGFVLSPIFCFSGSSLVPLVSVPLKNLRSSQLPSCSRHVAGPQLLELVPAALTGPRFHGDGLWERLLWLRPSLTQCQAELPVTAFSLCTCVSQLSTRLQLKDSRPESSGHRVDPSTVAEACGPRARGLPHTQPGALGDIPPLAGRKLSWSSAQVTCSTFADMKTCYSAAVLSLRKNRPISGLYLIILQPVFSVTRSAK